MMKNLLRAGAFLLALTLAPLASAGAQDRHGRKRRHVRTRRHVVKIHDDNRNPTPGVPRRVERGRDATPGTPRGSFPGTPSTFPAGEGRRLGAAVRRDEDRGIGRRGKRVGGGTRRGRSHDKH